MSAALAHLVDGLHIVRSDILVLKVVRVLPYVNPEQRDQPGRRLQRVLWRECTFCIVRQPNSLKLITQVNQGDRLPGWRKLQSAAVLSPYCNRAIPNQIPEW